MSGIRVLVIILCVLTALVVASTSNISGRRTTSVPDRITHRRSDGDIVAVHRNKTIRVSKPIVEEYAQFKANDATSLNTGVSSYIDVGVVDVKEGFSLSMEVLPSPANHNGVLFATGSIPQFQYYENQASAANTQFVVVEFIHSALSLTLKPLGQKHLKQLEIYRTYPVPYYLDDVNWHTVMVKWVNSTWTLSLDNMTISQRLTVRTNVTLYDKTAFIGGRPGYLNHQFQGIIRRVRLDGHPVALGGKRTEGHVTIQYSTSQDVAFFINFLKQLKLYD